ncbi:MAG: hypothetical protein K6E85_09060 [Lachnospiraceae bacterium]|nr:hypothetical protein [Lachnospiraceae bacterium]
MKKFNLLKGFMLSLLTLALCFAAFGAVKAQAGVTASYNPIKDTIVVSSDSGSPVYYIDLGKSGKQKIKDSKVKTLSLSGSGTSYSGEIVLDNKDDGLKIGENKAIYLYYSHTDPTTVVDKNEKIVDQTANFTLKGSTVKKFSVTLNYAKAESGDNINIAFTAADAAGKTIADPQTKVIFRFSEDGKEFDDWKEGTVLTADYLYKKLAATDGKYTFQFKLKGDATTRGSKLIKVKIAKPAKAPKVKVDFLKGTVALKNGFDYYVATSASAPETSVQGWMTILPANKAGSVTKGNEIIPTGNYTPYAKASDAISKTMFAKEKVKDIPVSSLFSGEDLEDAEKIYLFVRKSATAKKPASAVSEDPIEIAKQAAAPTVTSLSGEYDTKKKTFTFTFSSASGELECLILADSTEPTDLSATKWVKIGSKGIVTGKTKTKVSKSKANTLKVDSYILLRVAGEKGSTLPSAYVKGHLVKEGSGSAQTCVLQLNNNN